MMIFKNMTKMIVIRSYWIMSYEAIKVKLNDFLKLWFLKLRVILQ